MSNVTFPDTLFSSSDFGGDDLVLSPPAFMTERENCRKESFGSDFDPDYIEWNKIAGSEDLYSTVEVRTQDGKHKITTIRVQAIWSDANGSFKLEDIEFWPEDEVAFWPEDESGNEDLDAYTNSLLSFTAINA